MALTPLAPASSSLPWNPPSFMLFFAPGSTEISQDAQRTIDTAINAYARLEYKAVKLLFVVGHSDSQEAGQEDLRLSQARADVVKGALIDGGISEDRIQTGAYGASKPLPTPARSRRVEIFPLK
ncbi:MAG: OmpA family protein [Bradyrhizobium sp.]|nr:OmpA family protein [Bradyrhizobium sp.]